MRLASGSALSLALPVEPSRGAVLFLHGVGGGAWSWAAQAAAIASDRHAYLWEARGHGLAAGVADAGLGDYYADAREALAYVFERHGPVWIAGHSMGGLLALALGAEFAGRVRGLVLADPVYAPEGGRHGGPLFAAFARRLAGPLAGSISRNGRVARLLSRRVFEAAFLDRAAMERAWRRQRTQVPVEYPKMMYEAFDGPSHFPNRAFGREILRPVLLLETAGPRSPRIVELAADLAPLHEFTAVALDGGHYLQLDRSAAHVTRELVQFLARW